MGGFLCTIQGRWRGSHVTGNESKPCFCDSRLVGTWVGNEVLLV